MTGRITLKVTLDDQGFDWLFHTAQEWASQMDGTTIAPSSGFRHQISDGRFQVAGAGGLPSTGWKWGYWTDQFSNVILGRAYLDAWGIDCEVVSDEAGGWGILTDYEQKREG